MMRSSILLSSMIKNMLTSSVRLLVQVVMLIGLTSDGSL